MLLMLLIFFVWLLEDFFCCGDLVFELFDFDLEFCFFVFWFWVEELVV